MKPILFDKRSARYTETPYLRRMSRASGGNDRSDPAFGPALMPLLQDRPDSLECGTIEVRSQERARRYLHRHAVQQSREASRLARQADQGIPQPSSSPI